MKKLIPSSFAILIALCMWLIPATANSQTVINEPLFASFESGDVNPFDFSFDSLNGTLIPGANSITTGINTTSTSLIYTSNNSSQAWWGKLILTANASYTIQPKTDAHKYLHFYAYSTSNGLRAEVQVKSVSGTAIYQGNYTLDQKNTWQEIIIDLGANVVGSNIGKILVAPDLDGFSANAVYMLDQFSLSDIAGTYYSNPVLSTFEDDFTSPFTLSIDGGNLSTITNANIDGVNNSGKCLSADYPSGSDWWHKVKIEAKSTIVILPASANHKYLHFLCMRDIANEVYIEIYNKAGVQIYVKHFTPSLTNAWEEIVLDLTLSENSLAGISGQNIGKIWIYPAAGGGPVSHNKFDKFVLSDSKDPIGYSHVVNNVANFDGTSYIVRTNCQNANSTATIESNPLPFDSHNSTANALKYNVTTVGEWWQSLQLYMNGYMKVGSPDSYLHFMMYNPGKSNFTVVLADVQGDEKTIDFTVTNSNSWQDYVIDLDALSLTNVTSINFRMAAANVYYIDEIVVNNSSASRTPDTVSSINAVTGDPITIYSSNGTVFVSAPNLKSVNVFTTNGVLVAKKSGINLQKVQIDLSKGIYIIKSELNDGSTYSRSVRL